MDDADAGYGRFSFLFFPRCLFRIFLSFSGIYIDVEFVVFYLPREPELTGCVGGWPHGYRG